MFGQNPVMKPHFREDGKVEVKEIFYTIQGEGPLAGRPAVFVRTSGCNLRCFFCDTDFSDGELLAPDEVYRRVEALMPSAMQGGGLVVITGGEPLAQQIVPMVEYLWTEGEYAVQIETAGTCWPSGGEGDRLERLLMRTAFLRRSVSLVCSPKTPLVHAKVAACCRAYKYIIRSEEQDPTDLLPAYSTQQRGHKARLYRPMSDPRALGDFAVYVQPCDEGAGNEAATNANWSACVQAALAKGYRLSLQQHKLLNLP